MDEKQFACIRQLANFSRVTGATKSSVRRAMLADGWTDEEIRAAIAALNPSNEPSDSKS